MTQLALAGTWALSDDRGEYACAITFPTDGITALHDAGLIPDPYWGRNEYDLRWIAERDWDPSIPTRRRLTGVNTHSAAAKLSKY